MYLEQQPTSVSVLLLFRACTAVGFSSDTCSIRPDRFQHLMHADYAAAALLAHIIGQRVLTQYNESYGEYMAFAVMWVCLCMGWRALG